VSVTGSPFELVFRQTLANYVSPAMGRIEDRLAELGLVLPKPFAPPPGVQFKFDLVRVSGGVSGCSGDCVITPPARNLGLGNPT
jgi:hypothetical protein